MSAGHRDGTTAGASRAWSTASSEETAAVGRELGAGLAVGDVVHLVGDLGAGKTVLVRGMADGLGLDADEVSSPTFTLIQEYRREGRPTLFHVDLYRLAGGEVRDLELDALAEEGVVAIEWANRMPDADDRAIVVRIEDDGDDRRRITVDWPPS